MPAYHCPHAEACPGCPLIEQEPDQQLAYKRSLVAQAIAPYALLGTARLAEIIPAEPAVGYRVRAKLVAKDGKLGLYARGSHELVDVPECIVLRPRLREVALAIRPLLPAGVTAVDLREADDGVLLTLIARDDVDEGVLVDLARLIRERVPAVASVALSARDPESPQLLGAEPRVVNGPEALRHLLDLAAPWGLAAHGAFSQAHAGQAARLHAAIESALERRLKGLAGRRILELHGGSGLLALRLAARGAKVTLVEAFAPATKRALQAAAEQGLELEAIASDASSFCEELLSAGQRFDAVLVNPARRGLESRLRERIARLGPGCLVYVSCAPRSLARDASDFARLGLLAESFTPLDKIPLSDAVEVLAELAPAPVPTPRVIFEDEEMIVVDKLPHETMASLLARVRQLPGADHAAIVQRLETGASGVCVFARQQSHVTGLTKALALSGRRYLALVKGRTRKAGTVQRLLREGARKLPARTRYERQRVIAGHSLLALELEQERPQQVERHLSGLGHPLLGDTRHGDVNSNSFFWHRFGLDRPFLHLERMVIAGASGTIRELCAELSSDLNSVLAVMTAGAADHS